MAKIENANEYLEIKQKTNRDSRQMGVLTSDRYEAESTPAQTIINLNFTITQSVEQKRGFLLYIDGQLLREGVSNDFTFTNISGNQSSQVTLNAAIPAGLNIVALKIGGYSETFPNPSSVTAALNATNLEISKKGNINKIINGSFEYWQRGTSFVSPISSTLFSDRWIYNKASTATHTITRDTDVPTSAFGVYSANLTVTTADASVAAGDIVTVNHIIEGNFFRSLKGKNCVLQFWVKSAKTGVHCVGFSNNASNRNLIKEYTVNVANTWELKQIRFTHDTTGTWLYDTGRGLLMVFSLMAGSTWHGTADVWNTSAVYATANQVNVCDTIGNSFKLADVMLVEDNATTDLLPTFTLAGGDTAEELRLCQRYYEKSYNVDVNPAAVTVNGAVRWANAVSTISASNSVTYKVQKRVSSTNVIYSTSGASGFLRNTTDSTDVAVTLVGGGENGLSLDTTAAGVANKNYTFHWTSDAEL